jgi:hypothetical protein
MPAPMTLAHFSVPSAVNFPKPPDEPGNAVPPRCFNLRIRDCSIDFSLEFFVISAGGDADQATPRIQLCDPHNFKTFGLS